MTSSSCPSIDRFVNDQPQNVYAFADLKNNPTIKRAIFTCCGSSNTFESDDGCFVYCGMGSYSDTAMLQNCFVEQVGLKTWVEASSDFFEGANKLATTWPWPTETATQTYDDETITLDAEYWASVSRQYDSEVFTSTDGLTSMKSGHAFTSIGTGPSNTGIFTNAQITASPQNTASAGAIPSIGSSAAATTTASGAKLSRTRTSFSTLTVVGLLLLSALV